MRTLTRLSRIIFCHPRGSAQLSEENHEIRNQWHFHLKAIVSTHLSVIPALFSVIPALFSVIPAEAGTQGPMRHIAGVMAFPLTRSCRLPWAPACAGVTVEEAGVTASERDGTKAPAAELSNIPTSSPVAIDLAIPASIPLSPP